MSYHDFHKHDDSHREAILRLENIDMEFFYKGNSLKALDNISFSLLEGKNLGIIGESGSGKSTIAKIITGLHKPTRGKLFFEEKEIKNFNRQERKELCSHIQMVFQNAISSFNPRRKIGLSISENLCQLCASTKEEAKYKVVELLKDVGLSEEYAEKYPHQMSGGECQRAAIARAMSVCPKVLICDEATSALDVSAQARIVELLMKLKEEKDMSMIFITHDLPLVSTITDNIIIMNKGKIVEQGPSRNIIKKPQTTYTKELLNAVL